jgi:hypothetical protein
LNHAGLSVHGFLLIIGCKLQLQMLMPWLLMAFAATEVDGGLQCVTKLGTDE